MTETMTDKNTVLEAIRKLPDDVSLQQIVEEMKIFAALRMAHADSISGRSKTHSAVGTLIREWMNSPTTSTAERLSMAKDLLDSDEPDADQDEIDAAWEDEINERVRRYEAGETKSIDGAEVFAEFRRRYPK